MVTMATDELPEVHQARWVPFADVPKGMLMAAAQGHWRIAFDRPPLQGFFLGTVQSVPSGSGKGRIRIRFTSGSQRTITQEQCQFLCVPDSNEEGR